MDLTERKRAEEALRESEERLRYLLYNAPIVLSAWDKEGKYELFEGKGLEELGIAPGALVGQYLKDVLPGVTGDDVMAGFRRALEGKVTMPEVKMADRWWTATSVPLTDKNGETAGVIGVSVDITERKQAEEALRASEERLRYLLSNAPIVLHAWDADGNYELLEGKALEKLGVKSGEWVGQNLKDLVGPVSQGAMNAGFKMALERPITIPEANTGDIWWSTTSVPVRDADGNASGVIAVSVDITERMEALEALRRSEARYRALYQDNPSMYFTVAEDGTVLSVNQFGAAQLGYTPDDLTGKSVYEVFHRGDRAAVRKQLVGLAESPGKVETWEARKVRKDGEVIWVKESARAVKDTQKKITFLVVCEDISERKRIEAAMAAAREELEKRAEQAVARGVAYGLSFREVTVLDLVAGGKSDKEIAVLLGIRPMTVSKHVANVLKKMNAASRAEAGVRAWREGLIR
jgi:PAS domain S-box-containing protein